MPTDCAEVSQTAAGLKLVRPPTERAAHWRPRDRRCQAGRPAGRPPLACLAFFDTYRNNSERGPSICFCVSVDRRSPTKFGLPKCLVGLCPKSRAPRDSSHLLQVSGIGIKLYRYVFRNHTPTGGSIHLRNILVLERYTMPRYKNLACAFVNYAPLLNCRFCWLSTFLPRQVMKERLLFAAFNCSAIDGDDNFAGMNAAALGWDWDEDEEGEEGAQA